MLPILVILLKNVTSPFNRVHNDDFSVRWKNQDTQRLGSEEYAAIHSGVPPPLWLELQEIATLCILWFSFCTQNFQLNIFVIAPILEMVEFSLVLHCH